MQFRILAIILCALILVVSGCSRAHIKYVSDAETLELTRDYVQSAAGMSNVDGDVYVRFVFTEKGRNDFRLMTERNAGKCLSVYFGDRIIRADLYLTEPMDSREMTITMPDEETMRQVIRSYSK